MRPKHLLHVTYLLSFFVSLHTFSVVYVNSSVLENIVSARGVGLLYAIASLAAIVALIYTPRILRNVGDVRASLILVALELFVAILFVLTLETWFVIILFILQTVLTRLLWVDLDIFLETASTQKTTGRIRGIALTVSNTALILSPLLIGFLLGSGTDYSRVYLFSLCAILPALALLALSFRHFKDPRYKVFHFRKTLLRLLSRPALRRIAYIDFTMRFFYAWMVIYMPLYLHIYQGISWGQIGIIFTIMLIPFVLLEFPLGRLADTRFGEKEMLVAGLGITALATVVLPFITTSSVVVWAIALLATRIGASTIEVMGETYFFKHITTEEADLDSVFRMVEPIAYVIAPVISSLLLLFLPLPLLFLILGGVVATAIPVAFSLVDTA